MVDLNNIERPTIPYVTPSLPNSDRYELLQGTGQAPTGEQFDGDYNYGIAVDIALKEAIDGVAAGAIPGSNQSENANKFVSTNGQDPATLFWTKVSTENIDDISITESKLADGSVTTAKLGNGSIIASKIRDNAVTGPAILDGSISINKMGLLSVDTGQYVNESITEPKIADNAVSERTMIANSVSTAKVQDEAITRDKLSEINRFPIGFVSDYAGVAAPTGWLFCIGQAVSRTTYADLFVATGSGAVWGAGDGTTTFNVPDIRGRATIGCDPATAGTNAFTSSRVTTATASSLQIGGYGGEEQHTLITDEIPSHSHNYNFTGRIVTTGLGGGGNVSQAEVPASTATSATGGGLPHNNMIPNIFMPKIIYAGV